MTDSGNTENHEFLSKLKTEFSIAFRSLFEILRSPRRSILQGLQLSWSSIGLSLLLGLFLSSLIFVVFYLRSPIFVLSHIFSTVASAWLWNAVLLFILWFGLKLLKRELPLRSLAEAWVIAIIPADILSSITHSILSFISISENLKTIVWVGFLSSAVKVLVLGYLFYLALHIRFERTKREAGLVILVIVLLHLFQPLQLFLQRPYSNESTILSFPSAYEEDLDSSQPPPPPEPPKTLPLPTDPEEASKQVKLSEKVMKWINENYPEDNARRRAVIQEAKSRQFILDYPYEYELGDVLGSRAVVCSGIHFGPVESHQLSKHLDKLIFDTSEKIRIYAKWNAHFSGTISGLPPDEEEMVCDS